MRRALLTFFASVFALGLLAMSPAPAEARFGDGACVTKHVRGHTHFWVGMSRHGKAKRPFVNRVTGMFSVGAGSVTGTFHGVVHGVFGCR